MAIHLQSTCRGGKTSLRESADYFNRVASDHNGFTHQDPGFLDLVVNKSAA